MALQRRFISAFLLLVLFVGVVAYARAQEGGTNDTSGSAQVDQYREQLQKQLKDLEAQIDAQQKILNQKKTQQVSLERDIAILDAQITQAKLSIQARNIVIKELSSGIAQKQHTIGGLNSQLERELQSLGAFMRQVRQIDGTPLSVIVLSSKNLSTFFADLNRFDELNAQMQQSFIQIQNTKQLTQKEEDQLQSQKDEETSLLQAQELQRQQIQQQQNEKNMILAETKGQEKSYQKLIADTQKSAAQIRAALFQLNGSAAIPFGKALDYANLAAQKTGIRPAFLLGIIAEESNLGENVGKGTYTVDMHPTRDVPVFRAITASLGMSPDQLPVSKKQWYGWGGAMGPAQFIPSTWAMYAGYVKPDYHYDQDSDRVGKLTGSRPPNPWDPKDAFMAAAIYLTDNGAAGRTPTTEFHAAMCYLAGCGNANKKSLAFYGNSVAALAEQYQQQIDVINSGS